MYSWKNVYRLLKVVKVDNLWNCVYYQFSIKPHGRQWQHWSNTLQVYNLAMYYNLQKGFDGSAITPSLKTYFMQQLFATHARDRHSKYHPYRNSVFQASLYTNPKAIFLPTRAEMLESVMPHRNFTISSIVWGKTTWYTSETDSVLLCVIKFLA